LLEESLRHRVMPDKIIYSETELSDRGRWLIKQFENEKITLNKISSKELSGLSAADTSQGIIGLFKIREYKPGDAFRKARKVLLLDNISDPGNVGTLIRSALAFGFNTVLVTDNTVDPYNPKVVRSSAGAIFGIPIIKATTDEIMRFKKYSGFKLIVADMKGIDLHSKKLNIKNYSRLVLALGSEATGVSDYISKMSDIRIRIGHSEKVESLNVAIAGSLIMMELYK